MTTKPPRLQPGDTIGIISPSWGGGARYPHRIERGAAHLRSLGFKVKMASHALNSIGRRLPMLLVVSIVLAALALIGTMKWGG